ncbi:hypothetical protein DAPPUDRAFT_117076 [Daphnia pulex]|uniref:mRNA guanylyltransferase n=1 Tax=Daphnia pulex TaxID=6669 RepID=E9HRG0_DAPPU|nr:hypothetical protein DAPPUDRAFT_117076 [Daphnia pulex]|eukprot:EFX65670.1 hypothetical protein DAPPUDRAFT_117076 [Daphnia pulex]
MVFSSAKNMKLKIGLWIDLTNTSRFYDKNALNWSVGAAVKEFSKARYPGIYKEHYIRELFTLYGDTDDAPLAPALPMWDCEADDDTPSREETEAVDDDDQVGGSTGEKKKKKHDEKWHKRMPSSWKFPWIEGTSNYCNIPTKCRGKLTAPDRNNTVFQIEGVSFFSSQIDNHHLVDTLIDGEMVIDKADGMRYLIYEEIIEPRKDAMKSGRIIREREPIGIRRKEFWHVSVTSALYKGEKFMRQLGHEPDGLVCQPIEECSSVLKWKPPSHNSVDFRLRIVIENRPGMLRERIGHLYVGGKNDTPFAIMKATKEMVPLDNKIIECRYEMNNGNGKWVFMRQRTDKSFPNSCNTATAVCQSIREPVMKEILEDFILNLRAQHSSQQQDEDLSLNFHKYP